MNKTGIRCFLMTLALLLSSAPLPAYAAKVAGQVVRVGYFAFSGYQDMDDNGRMSGYGYEFLQKIGTHMDWEYDYVGYDKSYAEALEMLERGEVDVVTSVSKTKDRMKKFLFSEKPIGTNATIFTVKAGNTDVVAGDYATYNGLKIGMLDGNSKNKNFEAFAAKHGFSYEPVYYRTEKELSGALQEEAVDGIVSGSLRVTKNEWMLESFDAADFYIVVRKDRKDLMEQINQAIDALDIQEAGWRNALHAKYYAMDSGGELMLDGDERDYLRRLAEEGTKLKVLVNPDREPYSYFEDGEAKGVFPSVFALMAGRVSLPYEFVCTKDRIEYDKKRESGEADIVLDFANDYYLAEQAGYKITAPYLYMNFTRLTLNGFEGEAGRIAAVRNSDVLNTYISENYDKEAIIYFDSVAECVRAVEKGEADATILYTYVAERVVREDVKNRFSFTLMGDASFSYAIGVCSADGHILLSILNKAVGSLKNSDLSAAIIKETANNDLPAGKRLLSFYYANPVYGVLTALFASLFLFLCLLLALHIRNRGILKKKIAEVSAQYEAQKKDLSDALALADQANRAKTTFLNNMSHDIRTPMNAIIGFTALAASHLDNRERTEDYLAKIAQSSSHLLSLINDVLDMSRIESGKFTIEEKPENLPEILHGLRNIIQADVHARRLELFIDTVDVTDENICCDKLRLNQVLLNLLSNAIKFTDPGGTVSLRVTQKPSEKEGYAGYEFCVRDTGIGMSREFAETIFEPFTRERNTTVSGIQGTGLGMSITKNIVNMMGGEIHVFSEKGKGTEFTVSLAFRLDGGKEELEELVELKGLHGLVVDDDIVSCQSVSKMLRQFGTRAEWTMYGKEAVIRTAEALDVGDPYQIYIIDWSMPDMNGVETVRQIRRVVGHEAPIILLSAYDWSDIEDEAREAGVTDFVSKPLFMTDLHRALGHALGRGKDVAMEELPLDKGMAGRRILLAEDNELNREIAVEILSAAGYLVESAENGRIACEMLEASEAGYYDAVLMDVQMPVMDGYEATQRIRAIKDPALASVPVIAMTANAFEEDRKKAMEMGMDGHLAKPIDVEKMLALLTKIIRRKQAGSGGLVFYGDNR